MDTPRSLVLGSFIAWRNCMRKMTVAGGFLVVAFATARVDAQMVDAQTQIRLTESVAASDIPPVVTLEDPGSEIGATVRKLRSGEAVAPKLGRGVVVESVTMDGPASRAGLKPGDIIFFYARGADIDEKKQFARLVHETPPGHVLPVAVVRDGVQMALELIPELGRAGPSQQP
jgi:predicted metalloprotease with PDZ domain